MAEETTVQNDYTFNEPQTPPMEEPKESTEELYAGKYKTVEELVKGYKSLESKLGSNKTEETPEVPPTPEEPPKEVEPKEPEAPVTIAGLPADKYINEYTETGVLSEASYKELADKGIPKAFVDAYIAGQKAVQANAVNAVKQSESELFDYVGGQEEFAKMAEWAATGGYTEAEKATYTNAIESGNVGIAKMALDTLKAKYTKANGSAPSLIGGALSTSSSGYSSPNEMVAAMRDPRYGKDPAYTAEVERKVSKMKI